MFKNYVANILLLSALLATMSATLYTSMLTTMPNRNITNLRMDGLTEVGARDAWANKETE